MTRIRITFAFSPYVIHGQWRFVIHLILAATPWVAGFRRETHPNRIGVL